MELTNGQKDLLCDIAVELQTAAGVYSNMDRHDGDVAEARLLRMRAKLIESFGLTHEMANGPSDGG